MRGVSALNALWLLAAMATSTWLTWAYSVRTPEGRLDETEGVERADVVVDADGHVVPVRAYERIASASTIADQVLLRILEPSRVAAVSRHSLDGPDDPWRYDGKIGIGRAEDLEAIIELRPDLVLLNGFIDVRTVQRMKEAGLTVFNLGEMRGTETLIPNIKQVAAVVGVPERGEALAEEFTRRFDAVAGRIPEGEKQRALYAGIHGDRLYGGTAGTSFHDVLDAAGLIDVAAEAGYRDWPAYTNEQILTLDPPWIITNDKSEEAFCRHPGFHALSACANGRVRGISTDLLTDPGLGMLRAAEAVHAAVYGS
ncbi:MAG: ABC transporter substrate-binding protein [Myxococcota bacterium]